jgi:hypothetical protein
MRVPAPKAAGDLAPKSIGAGEKTGTSPDTDEVGTAGSETNQTNTSRADNANIEPAFEEKLATGAERGLDPTPESIRQGSVRMEAHPEYAKLTAELESKGYSLRLTDRERPHVVVKEVVTPTGELIRIEKVLVANPGMRFLDLEHELGHVAQLEQTKRPLVTDQVLENGKPYSGPNGSDRLTTAQDAVLEYHNRLVEYFRLKERGVAREILDKHRDGVRTQRQLYWKKGMSSGRSPSATTFVHDNVSDLPDLDRRFIDEEGL